jgi:hypothetical protein
MALDKGEYYLRLECSARRIGIVWIISEKAEEVLRLYW